MNNRFQPPQAEVKDIAADQSVSLSRPGLVRLYHRLVLGSISLGLLLSLLPWTNLPISVELQQALQAGGLGAVAPLSAVSALWWITQPLWVVAGIGLYFFRQWARWLFVALYAVSMLSSFVRGAAVQLPWEAAFQTAVTLIDGALFVLVFLPPLSEVFRGESA
jgi:hypothetical protein